MIRRRRLGIRLVMIGIAAVVLVLSLRNAGTFGAAADRGGYGSVPPAPKPPAEAQLDAAGANPSSISPRTFESGTPRTPTEQAALREIEGQYEKLEAAHRAGNLDAIMALRTPDFHFRGPDGKVGTATQMVDYSRALIAAVDSVVSIKNTIRGFRLHGDTVETGICQEFSRFQHIDRRRRLDTSVLQRETWVRTAAGWKLARVEDVHDQRMFVDGVRVDPLLPYAPGGPPYAPAVDPQSGCGRTR